MVGWLVLGGLAYVLVTAVLYVTSLWVRYQTRRHDLAVQAHRRHLQKGQAAKEQPAGELKLAG
jgi:hypothetical protein